jgi:hypothetical protein
MTHPASPGGDERTPPGYDPGTESTPAYDALAAEAPLGTNPPTDEPSMSSLGEDPLTGPRDLGRDPLTGPRDLPDDDPLTAPLPPVQPPQTLTPEADYAVAPNPGAGGGPLAQVTAFAKDKPAAFLGVAVSAGWLLGRITSRRGGN